MIKFQYIIHKETGTVIKYEDWKEYLKNDTEIGLVKISYNPFTEKKYGEFKPKEMLFSDEFEIIYNSEFTLQELALLFDNINQKELANKILNLCIDKKSIKDKYGIDI